MAHWEFLLQKKGDRRWETLQIDTLSLFTGEYRLAGRGAAQVEIHCEITTPQGQVNRRKTTNHQGLLAIMPFRPLRVGQWVVTCRSLDVSNPWEKSLTLQVRPRPQVFRPLPLPPNPNLLSFETDFSLAGDTKATPKQTQKVLDESLAQLMGTGKSEETTTAAADTPEVLLQSSLAELDELLKAELEPIWAEMDQAALAAAPITPPPVPESPYQLCLSHNTYGWHGPQPVTLQGEIRWETETPPPEMVLVITLRDPQTAAVVTTLTGAIAPGTSPQPFSQAIALTDPLETLMLLGEIRLQTTTGEPLATQSFNLVADYQAIAAHLTPEEAPTPEPPAASAVPTKQLQLSNADPEGTTPMAAVSATTPPTILPPKLKTLGKKSKVGLDLPKFAQKAPETPSTAEADLPLEMAESDLNSPDSSITAETPLISETSIPEALASPEPEALASSEVEAPPAVDPAEDLDWNSRFFTRLNALAVDGGDSTWLTPPPIPAPGADIATPEPSAVTPEAMEEEESQAAIAFPRLEIVLDSPEPEPAETSEVEATHETETPLGMTPPPDATPMAVGDQDPQPRSIPAPQISLDKDQYQVGDLATVQVTLPTVGDRLYVKLWLQDRQTRELLAGPFQLTSFSPDPGGQPHCRQDIVIPPGALEIRFEAIAIEPRSQQESRKVGLDRQVLPKVADADVDWQAFESDFPW